MRVAIIGVGRMGRNHVQVVRELGLDLVGVCDQSEVALALTANEHDIPPGRQFTNASVLLEQESPECVIIATTAPSHCPYTCLATEAGVKYILCEKPMAVSIAQCDSMIQTCERNGTKLAINHQMRFMQQYTEPKRIIQSDEFGGLRSVTAVAGNVGLAMNGTHYFEMFRFMADEPPTDVTAWFSDEAVPNPRGKHFEDRAGSIRMTTSSGKRFYLEAGADQGHGVKTIYSGPYGQLVVDELAGRMYLSVRQAQHRNLPTTRYGMPGVETKLEIETANNLGPTRAVLEALRDDKGPPTGEDGRLAIALLVAAYVSNESGHIPVRPDDANLPLERVFPWA